MNTNIMTGYYGKDGVMTDGWGNEKDAIKEFEEFYKNNPEYDGCYVTEYNGSWVIAY